MKPRERVIKAIQHEIPDRTPLDGWFTEDYGNKLKNYLGLKDIEALNKRLGIDFRVIWNEPSREFKKKASSSDKLPSYWWVTENFKDEWGVKYSLDPTGMFFHFVSQPLQDAESIDDYEFPDINAPGRFDNAEKIAREYRNEYIIVGNMFATLFEMAWVLRGHTRFIRDLYANPRFANDLLDKLLEYRLEEGKRFIEIGVDILRFGDDLGTQTGLIMPQSIWAKYFKPRMRTLIRRLRKRGDFYAFYHSDGYIKPFIPELIDIGVDILNPVQPECMDPVRIKEAYGNKLTIHGTISLQETLPFGTREDVANEVRTRIKTLGYNGGLILAPSNYLHPDVPFQNLLALYDTAKKIKLGI